MKKTHLHTRLLARLGIVFVLLSAGVVFTGALAQAATPPTAATMLGTSSQRSAPALPPPSKRQSHNSVLWPSNDEDVPPTTVPDTIFINTHVITGNGSISPGTQVVNAGASITFTIVPSTGYYIDFLVVDDITLPAANTYAFLNITQSHSLEAAFAPYTYTLSSSAGFGGVISPSAQIVTYGASRTFTITPNSNYCILDVSVNGASQGPVGNYTFVNVTQNMTIAATFTNQFVITPTDDGVGGHWAPASPQTVPCGGDQTFNVVEFAGYHVANIYVDGVPQGPALSYSFTNVTASHILHVVFAPNEYIITPTVIGGAGSINPGTPQNVTYSSSITFTISPNVGHRIVDVGVDGVSQGTPSVYAFTNITANHTISALFALHTYLITPTAGAGGSITPSNTQVVPWGGAITFTITPNAGHDIVDVKVDGNSQGPIGIYAFSNVTASHTITAAFAPRTYTITPMAIGGGTITPSIPKTATYGASLTFTFTPNAGYFISNVVVDSASLGAIPSYTFPPITASRWITAYFGRHTYYITPSVSGGGGLIDPSLVQSVLAGDDSVIFSMIPNPGHRISDVVAGGIAHGAVSSFAFTNVLTHNTIIAFFARNAYLITPTAGSGGSISPSLPQVVLYNDPRTFYIMPNAGKITTDVLVDGVSQGPVPSYTFNNVSTTHTIHAVFDDATFLMTVWPTTNGVITPVTSEISRGASITYTIIPATGYHIANVWVDGAPKGMISTYVFTNVIAPHHISAAFAINLYAITATVSSAGGIIAPAGVQTYAHGSSQTYQVVADLDYYIGEVWVDGISQTVPSNSTNLNYNFNPITANHTITATFVPPVFSIFASSSPSGWGTISPSGKQFVPRNTSITFHITPANCYTIESVYVDGAAIIPPPNTYTFPNVTDNHIITATFIPRGYRITPSVIGNGTITPSSFITATYGNSYPFIITPNTGHYIAALTVTTGTILPNPTGMVYTFTNVCSTQFIVANFDVYKYPITASKQGNGSISPIGVITANYGSSLTFTSTPNDYHHIQNMWIDGALVSQDEITTTYVFHDITTPHSISVEFAPDPATLYAKVVNSSTLAQGQISLPGSIICISCEISYFGSPLVTATASSSSGKFLHWGGFYTGTNNPFSFQMIATRTLTAYFGLYRLYLPFVAKSPPCRIETSETEPNNSMAEALGQGALCSGQTYLPLPNDYEDWFYFDVPTASPGPVFITMTQNTAWGGQLQLRDSLNNLLGYSTGQNPFQIKCANYINPNCTPGTPFPPGRYYIVVYVTNNYNSTPYSLTVTYPSPAPP